MLEDDYAAQRLSSFTAGREQARPLNHFYLGAKKLDRKGIERFLEQSRRAEVVDGTNFPEETRGEDEDVGVEINGRQWVSGVGKDSDAAERQRREVLDESAVLELHVAVCTHMPNIMRGMNDEEDA